MAVAPCAGGVIRVESLGGHAARLRVRVAGGDVVPGDMGRLRSAAAPGLAQRPAVRAVRARRAPPDYPAATLVPITAGSATPNTNAALTPTP